MVLWPLPRLPVARAPVPTPAELPGDVDVGHIRAALDLDGDRRADALLVKYCSDRSAESIDGCDYVFAEIWQRVRSQWRLCTRYGPL